MSTETLNQTSNRNLFVDFYIKQVSSLMYDANKFWTANFQIKHYSGKIFLLKRSSFICQNNFNEKKNFNEIDANIAINVLLLNKCNKTDLTVFGSVYVFIFVFAFIFAYPCCELSTFAPSFTWIVFIYMTYHWATAIMIINITLKEVHNGNNYENKERRRNSFDFEFDNVY